MEAALDKAARVFRERGYHATSIADLTGAMELASGSVYKAFKDKRAVFLAVFDREAGVRGEKLHRMISAAKFGRDRVRAALTFYAKSSYGVEGRRGCLVVGSAAELVTFDAEVAQRVTAALHRNEKLMADLIRQGQADGSFYPGNHRQRDYRTANDVPAAGHARCRKDRTEPCRNVGGGRRGDEIARLISSY